MRLVNTTVVDEHEVVELEVDAETRKRIEEEDSCYFQVQQNYQ